MNLKSIGLGVAVAASVAAVSAPAQALSLAGESLFLDGNARISRTASNSFDFSFGRTTIAPETNSPPFVVGDSVSIATLTGISTTGTFGPIDDFITGIALTNGEEATFDLTSLVFDITERAVGQGLISTNYALTFGGNFVTSSGSIFGGGSLTTQFSRIGGLRVGQAVTSTLSGDITAVPTPALVPAALGFGAAMLRKRKGEEEEKAEQETADAEA